MDIFTFFLEGRLSISPDLPHFLKIHFCSFLFIFRGICKVFLKFFLKTFWDLLGYVHWKDSIIWDLIRFFSKFLSIFRHFFAINIFEKGQVNFFRMVCNFSHVLLDLTELLFMSYEFLVYVSWFFEVFCFNFSDFLNFCEIFCIFYISFIFLLFFSIFAVFSQFFRPFSLDFAFLFHPTIQNSDNSRIAENKLCVSINVMFY